MKSRSRTGRRLSLWAGALLLLTGGYSACSQTSDSNFQVAITLPTNGASFAAPVNIQIDALTFDTADDVASVSFTATPYGPGPIPMFVLYLGTVSNGVAAGPHSKLFSVTWSNAPAATYEWALDAQACRSNGTVAISRGVIISVQPGRLLSVNLASPTNGAIFTVPANIPLIAGAGESGGSVADVQFFDGPTSLGVVSNWVMVDPPSSPGLPPGSHAYFLTWTNAPAGIHVLTAVAVDTNGQSAVSIPVTITVGPGFPPEVRITSPPNNSVFPAPVNIALLAYAHDPAGYVANVQFFAGSTSLGFGLPLPPVVPETGSPVTPGPPILQTNTFELIWSNAPVGAFALSAVATDNSALSATSAPVNITILSTPPPPPITTNVVSIVATDPIAIAGTNSWPWLGLASATPTWSNWLSPNAAWCWFTNCGPKDATFAVRRAGPTNSDLTVIYTIGGTASNGVDYVTLPGLAAIPAGQREVMITVVPEDGQTNHAVKTVILCLSPSTSHPPDYVVGFPRRAEVLIVDRESPHPGLTGALLGDRSFHLTAGGPDGAWFRVDYTTDSINWTPVCTNQVVNGSIDFADPDAANSPWRLYRTVPLANPSSD
ncbi:MAG: Ig-like domain-containing protein [Verrucomicrobiota bacterium]|jgi:hypothetical protein